MANDPLKNRNFFFRHALVSLVLFDGVTLNSSPSLLVPTWILQIMDSKTSFSRFMVSMNPCLHNNIQTLKYPVTFKVCWFYVQLRLNEVLLAATENIIIDAIFLPYVKRGTSGVAKITFVLLRFYFCLQLKSLLFLRWLIFFVNFLILELKRVTKRIHSFPHVYWWNCVERFILYTHVVLRRFWKPVAQFIEINKLTLVKQSTDLYINSGDSHTRRWSTAIVRRDKVNCSNNRGNSDPPRGLGSAMMPSEPHWKISPCSMKIELFLIFVNVNALFRRNITT